MTTINRKQAALHEFMTKVDRLRSDTCRQDNSSMTEEQFNDYILQTHFRNIFASSIVSNTLAFKWRRCPSSRNLLKILAVIIVFTLILYTPFRQSVANVFMKNIQSCIYTGMSVWRLLTVPIIRMVPALTELYDESCLLENPMFQIQDMDCRPCLNVLNVLNLSDLDGQQQEVVGGGVPYVFKVSLVLGLFFELVIIHLCHFLECK